MNREYFKTQLLELFKSNSDWEHELDSVAYSTFDKQELIWAASDLAKEGYISEALRIAKHYSLYTDSADIQPHNDILAGEEVRYITTVRGTVCWLLLSIVSKLETAYFRDILDMLEGNETDTEEDKKLRLATGENLYIRLQATYTLEFLAANMNAVRNVDGTPFDFGEANRVRTEALAFQMLSENKVYPRVLEGLALVFNRMRNLNETKAMLVLETFFYSSNRENGLNPFYVLDKVDVLAVFYAEFRNHYDPEFNNSSFISFLKRILREGSSEIKGSILWHFWQAVKQDKDYYNKFKKYIEIIFQSAFSEDVISQIDFLIETLLPLQSDEAVELFEKLLSYLEKGVEQIPEPNHIFLSVSEQILPSIIKIKPEKFGEYLESLYRIWAKGVYVGDLTKILTLYNTAEGQYREHIKTISQEIHLRMKQQNNRIVDINWE